MAKMSSRTIVDKADQLAARLAKAEGWVMTGPIHKRINSNPRAARFLRGESTGPAWHSTFRCLLKRRQEEASK